MRRIATLLSIAVLVLFVLFVFRETREVVALAAAYDAGLGRAVLVALLAIYAICLGVPLVLFLRLPRPLLAPPDETQPAFGRYLARLASRLARNPRLRGVAIRPDRDGVTAALRTLHEQSRREIREAALIVFLTTAVSQSGRLDGLMVLIAHSRLVWRIAHLYAQRPALRELAVLYATVATAAFLAQSIDDVELEEAIESVLTPIVAGSALGAVPGLSGASNLVLESTLQGAANAFLTLRVGCIASRYCASVTRTDTRALRRSAAAEAAGMLPGVALDGTKKVTEAIWAAAKRSTIVERAEALRTGALKTANDMLAALRLRRPNPERPLPNA